MSTSVTASSGIIMGHELVKEVTFLNRNTSCKCSNVCGMSRVRSEHGGWFLTVSWWRACQLCQLLVVTPGEIVKWFKLVVGDLWWRLQFSCQISLVSKSCLHTDVDNVHITILTGNRQIFYYTLSPCFLFTVSLHFLLGVFSLLFGRWWDVIIVGDKNSSSISSSRGSLEGQNRRLLRFFQAGNCVHMTSGCLKERIG